MTAFSLDGQKIFVAGHKGMVGSAISRRLQNHNLEILTAERSEVDLREQTAVNHWFEINKPDVVFLAAATVGGILANDQRPGEFLYDNLLIAANVIEAAKQTAVKKLLFLGSSCIYPKHAPQPITEEALLTGPLEPTNQWYALAKIAGLKLCAAYRQQYGCDFISVQPTNLYGPGDTYDLQESHVIPALILKAHKAKIKNDPSLEIWGSGTPKREFLHVDDLADALVFLMENYSAAEHINVGYGEDLTIAELAELICDIVGYKGKIHYASDKPDGTPRKLLDLRRLQALGWKPRIGLKEGIENSYAWFLNNVT
ncbi:MAG: GDP-L-fucose synthase [Candidatus Obscuribacterales bacterium]|nr:GDP-L-fucose synthase [Candidatus Obscuribacterales bacterium]